MDLSIALEAVPKALAYAAVMLCVGASVGRGLLRFRVAALLTAGFGTQHFHRQRAGSVLRGGERMRGRQTASCVASAR